MEKKENWHENYSDRVNCIFLVYGIVILCRIFPSIFEGKFVNFMDLAIHACLPSFYKHQYKIICVAHFSPTIHTFELKNDKIQLGLATSIRQCVFITLNFYNIIKNYQILISSLDEAKTFTQWQNYLYALCSLYIYIANVWL